MAKENNNILERALLDANKIQEALNANTKEILRSVAMEEIDSVLKESLERDYVEEDVDDEDTDEVDVDTELETGEDDLTGGDDVEGDTETELDLDSSIEGDDLEGYYDSSMDADASEDELDMDMTGASDDEVIAIYKKLTDEDEIEVVVDDASGDVTLKVNQPGEFVIKSEQPTEDFSDELEGGDEFGGDELGLDTFSDEAPADDFGGDDFGGEDEVEDDFTSSDDMSDEFGDEDEEDEEVMYEIALDEDAIRTATSDINISNSGTLPTGNIEGTKATADDEITGDNLTGGFIEDTNGSDDNHADHIMNEDEIAEEEEELEGDEVSEKIQVGKERRVANNKTTIQGAGGDANKVKAPNVTAPNMNETIKKYNALLKEAKELKTKNGEYKEALKKFRTMLAETVVFNSNLTHVAKLFMEHSTTKKEKQGIFERFDNEVSTILESKKLYKSINSELGNRQPINESIENKMSNEMATSGSKQLIESTAYVDKETQRIRNLMNRVDNR